MDSVRTNEDVAGGNGAIGERDGDTTCVLLETVDMGAQAEARFAEAAEEDIEQISAVDVIVGRTEVTLRPLAEWGPKNAVPSNGVVGAFQLPQ